MSSTRSDVAASAGTDHLAQTLQPQVVHSLPGRVRLRFDHKQSEKALALAERLCAHPGVSSVRWSPIVRSLTIHFQPALPFWELLLNVPDPADGHGLTPLARRSPDWGRIALACLLALIPLGPAGSVAVALATEVVGQVNDRCIWLLSCGTESLAGQPLTGCGNCGSSNAIDKGVPRGS